MKSAWTAAVLDELVAATGVSLRRDVAACADASEDFGHLVRGTVRAVAQPRTAEEVASLLRFATDRGFLSRRGPAATARAVNRFRSMA
jgi:FAD/FMN-containing dehydrogenase